MRSVPADGHAESDLVFSLSIAAIVIVTVRQMRKCLG